MINFFFFFNEMDTRQAKNRYKSIRSVSIPPTVKLQIKHEKTKEKKHTLLHCLRVTHDVHINIYDGKILLLQA